MAEAIGMIEFKTTPGGILAADYMVKTAQVELPRKVHSVRDGRTLRGALRSGCGGSAL